MTNKFYKELVSFLSAIYDERFSWELIIDAEIGEPTKEKLQIYCDGTHLRTIHIEHILFLYAGGVYLEDEQMYLWQKELIDIIEGG